MRSTEELLKEYNLEIMCESPLEVEGPGGAFSNSGAAALLVTSLTQLEHLRSVVMEWQNQQGHDQCWYYTELFRRLAELLKLPPPTKEDLNLPSLEEFKGGCRRYQKELYG